MVSVPSIPAPLGVAPSVAGAAATGLHYRTHYVTR